jgi:hypothetical protein
MVREEQMSYRIPLELIEKLTLFEVSVENSAFGSDIDSEHIFQEFSDLSRFYNALATVDLTVKQYSNEVFIGDIPLLKDRQKAREDEDNLHALHQAIIENSPDRFEVDL